MKSLVCECGATTCVFERYAGVRIPKCSGCGKYLGEGLGDVSMSKDALQFYAMIYTQNRATLKKLFSKEPELLEEALRAKGVQEEEAYKRKMGMVREN